MACTVWHLSGYPALDFSGSAIVIGDKAGEAEANLLELKSPMGSVATLRGDGTLQTVGNIVTSATGRIVAGGDLTARGRLVLTHSNVEANSVVHIPEKAS